MGYAPVSVGLNMTLGIDSVSDPRFALLMLEMSFGEATLSEVFLDTILIYW